MKKTTPTTTQDIQYTLDVLHDSLNTYDECNTDALRYESLLALFDLTATLGEQLVSLGLSNPLKP